jgi:hypothetical protein
MPNLWRSWTGVRRKPVERRAERPAWLIAAVPAKRPPNRLDVRPTLERNATHDSAVTRVRVSRRVGFVIVQENLTDPAIRKSPDRRGVPQAGNLELERLATTPVAKSLALSRRRHGRSS